MAPPRVSIICIFLDMEDFLAEAIESVLGQEFDEFELLLVDDGSRDGSTDIALEFAEHMPDRVRYLAHQDHANLGTSASRNFGSRHARGECLAYIDADDVWRPAKLREQIEILDAQPETAMVCGTANYWQSWNHGTDRLVSSGTMRDGLSRPPQTLLRVYPLGSADMPCPSDVLIRRQVVEEIGGWEEEFPGFYDDCAFFSKIFAGWPVWFSSRTWLDYRLHGQSCSARTTAEGYVAARERFLVWLERYLATHDVAGKQKVLRATASARWELDHPIVGRTMRNVRSRVTRLRSRLGW